MLRLTEQQQAVYSYIRECMVVRGYGPTVREIGEHMDIKSPNGVMCHLRALERKGVIHRSANKKRAIELTEPLTRDGQKWPIRAQFANGQITQNSEPHQNLSSDAFFGRAGECFLIEVLDDHLQTAQICCGDLILVQPGNSVTPGCVVMGRLPIKRQWNTTLTPTEYWILGRCRTREVDIVVELLSQDKNAIRLSAEDVLGIAVGIIRKF